MEKKYNIKDSGVAFFLAIIGVLVTSFLLVEVVSFVVLQTGQTSEEVASNKWISYLSFFVSELVFLVAYFVVVGLKKDKSFFVNTKIKFGFDWKIFLLVMLLGGVCMFCSINMTGLFNYIFSFVSPSPLSSSIGVGMDNFWEFLMMVLLLAVVPAICEELLFRGVIFNGLRQKFSLKMSVMLSAILFMLVHLSIYKTFYQIILGVVLAVLVYYTGSIFYGMIFHFVNNFLIIFLSYAFKNGTCLEFTTWGVKEVLLSILIFAVGVVVCVFILKEIKKNCFKHKNYFNLDKNQLPLAHAENLKGLSEYDKKLIVGEQNSKEYAWLVVSVVFGLILWSLNSFGGFL